MRILKIIKKMQSTNTLKFSMAEVVNDFKYKGSMDFKNCEHIDDSECAISVKDPEFSKKKSKKKAFGVVVYSTKDFYKNTPEENKDLHICEGEQRQTMMNIFETLFRTYYGLEITQIVQGHEHGTENCKCHMQMIVSLAQETQRNIFPGEFKIGNNTYIFMAQKARNTYALTNYCKKDGDFVYLKPELAIKYVFKVDKKGEPTEIINPWATLVQNKDIMSKEQAQDLILTHEPRTAITMFKNIEYAIDKMCKPNAPEFQWKFPDWCTEDTHCMNEINRIKDWYIKYCIPEDLLRRKALILYGPHAIGKTNFVKSFVNDESYYVHSQSNFNEGQIKGKTPKLLIMDDMLYPKTDTVECWKQLLTGQKTSIRDAYLNFQWNYSVPCVVLTNKKAIFQRLALDPEFAGRCVVVEVRNYMGPPGTQPHELQSNDLFIYEDTREDLEQEKIRFDSKKQCRGDGVFGKQDSIEVNLPQIPTYTKLSKKNEKKEERKHHSSEILLHRTEKPVKEYDGLTSFFKDVEEKDFS